MAPEQTTNALVVRSSQDLAQVTELEQILLGVIDPPEVDDDPSSMSREIVAQLLAAETDEELESLGEAVGWGELEGVPMRIRNFRWLPSDYATEGGAPVYFVVQADRLDSGEPVVLTTGSFNILSQLTNMARRGTLHGAIRQLKRAKKQTKSGFYPMWLVTPEEVKRAKAAAAVDGGNPTDPVAEPAA